MNDAILRQEDGPIPLAIQLSPNWIPSDRLSAALCINYDTLIHLVLSFVTILIIDPIMLVLSLFYDKNEDFFVC